jgi:hypothetical protein
MGVGVMMTGLKEVRKMLKDEEARVRRLRKQAVIDAANLLIGDIQKSMKDTKKTTIGIKRGGKKKEHHPSLPKHPPAVMDSDLWKSIRYVILEDSKYRVIAEVGSFNVPYAAAMEYGYAPAGIDPRPWLGPAIDRNRERIFNKFRSVMRFGEYIK